ncbi:putative malate dehydrogenase [Erysiphe neolycopersici]|uniref:Putative malate dehydrogenase n=1 Tax=Erysiphe neolycopersici TaxID=212602 RepID=A0A420HPV5_9PEZI|nr:putative malate dehydrogenase [Erysiphe neolycopersici]
MLWLFLLPTISCANTFLPLIFKDFFVDFDIKAACNIEDARLTTAASTPLQPPSNDVKVMHVAIGKGSQNYTCLTNNPLDAPAPVGALATLFDASCIASKNPAKLAQLPKEALQAELPADESKTLTSSKIAVSGHHFFPSPQTPLFELVTAAANLGSVSPKKVDSKPAPPDAVVGKNNKGNGAVPWLKLTASGDIKEVYRVNTAGGNPPKTCQGMPKDFEVQYAAEYWFFKAKDLLAPDKDDEYDDSADDYL